MTSILGVNIPTIADVELFAGITEYGVEKRCTHLLLAGMSQLQHMTAWDGFL